MAEIVFNPYLGWLNASDPANIPAGTKVITAEDLMRYENLGVDVAEYTAGRDAEVIAQVNDPASGLSEALAGIYSLKADAGPTITASAVEPANPAEGDIWFVLP
jgi:hypothetical protein